MVVSRSKKLNQIGIISTMTGTMTDSLNNNAETVVHVAYKSVSSMRIKVTKERLDIILNDM